MRFRTIAAGVLVAGVSVASVATGTTAYAGDRTPDPVVTAPPANIQEDEPGWDCETMGNRICGAVAVETYVALDGSYWVRVWDEHNRIVFGPNLVEKFES